MASQRDQQQLKSIGLEGFAMIDECHGQTRRPNSNQSAKLHYSPQPRQVLHQSHYQYFYYQHQQSYVCQVPQVYTVTKEPVIISCHGTSWQQYYDGRSISEGPQVYTVTKEPVANCHGTSQHRYYGEGSVSEGTRVYTVTKEPVANCHGTSQHRYYGERSVSEGTRVYTVTKEPVSNCSGTSSQHQSYGGRSKSEGPQDFPVVTKEPVINHHGTSPQHQYCGGRSIVRPQVSGAKESFVRSNEAAEFHGGTMVLDYSKNKPLRQAYY